MSLSQEIEYTDEVSQVIKVKMGILSPEKILKQSVCEVYNHILSPDPSQWVGTLFDPRMGARERNKVNALSNLTMLYDPGNFGHIEFAKPVILYHYLGPIISVLNNVCNVCSSLLVDKNNQATIQALQSKGKKGRFAFLDKIRTKEKIKNCPNCGACIIKFSKDKDGVARISIKQTIIQIPGDITSCKKMEGEEEQGGEAGDEDEGEAGEDEEEEETKKKKKVAKSSTVKTVVTETKKKKGQDKDEEKKKEVKSYVDPEVALNILEKITDEDVELMGFDKDLSRPDWMIWTRMPVPPPSMRPAVTTESGQTSDDDLTHKLNDIVKTNNQIRNLLEENDPEKTKYINHWWQLLQYHVATYIDNEISNVPSAVNRSGRPYKTLHQRIKAKEGRIRGNLMGKRVDGSARTVITPDPNISIDQLGVPMEIMTNLTYPEVVSPYNCHTLTQLVRNGPEWPGAKCIKYKDRKIKQNVGSCPSGGQRCSLKYRFAGKAK